MTYKVGIISDTHGLLRPEVESVLARCDAVIHAGDIDNSEILSELYRLAPVYAVRGNNDIYWAEHLPRCLSVTLGGINFFAVHNLLDIPADLGNTDIFVFGHSHEYFEKVRDGCLWLNPGSCGWRGSNHELSMAVVNIRDGKYTVEKIVIDD